MIDKRKIATHQRDIIEIISITICMTIIYIKLPQYHFQRTFIEFTFSIRLHYGVINGRCWKKIYSVKY